MPESGSIKEKRNHLRVSLPSYLTYFNFTSNKVVKAKVNNMSGKGLGFETEEELEPAMPLDIWIDISDSGEQAHAEGEVIWVKKISKDKYSVGVALKSSGLMPAPNFLKKMKSDGK